MPLTSSRIDSAWRRYKAEIYGVASMVFVRVIKPYCQDNKLSFKVRDGVWTFTSMISGECYRLKDINSDIIDLLQGEIPGVLGVSLGSLMPDYEYISEQ